MLKNNLNFLQGVKGSNTYFLTRIEINTYTGHSVRPDMGRILYRFRFNHGEQPHVKNLITETKRDFPNVNLR